LKCGRGLFCLAVGGGGDWRDWRDGHAFHEPSTWFSSFTNSVRNFSDDRKAASGPTLIM
jgi:hypothetical protein